MSTPRRTIVLIEDDPDLRALCADVFAEAAFDVVECATISAGLTVLRQIVPAIVVLDGDLPDGSGLDLARWMRDCPAYDDVRIIGFSARNTPPEVAAAIAAGCDAFVGKPCSPEYLIAQLDAPPAP